MFGLKIVVRVQTFRRVPPVQLLPPSGSFHLLTNSVLHQNDENTNLRQGQSEIFQGFGTIFTKRGEEELGECRDYEAAR